MDWFAGLQTPASALAVLTAMITPAVLISACGALIFSTSSRLGRVVDRVRALTAKFEELARHPEADDMAEERRVLIFGQLWRQSTRARLIQRAMVAFYVALGIFVATSIAVAVVGVVAQPYTWVSVILGLLGASFMLYGSFLLIIESRLALGAITSEMDFVQKISRKHGQGIEELSGGPITWLGRKIG
jgi:threonine/homoserine/homoserine lactone efflux protein